MNKPKLPSKNVRRKRLHGDYLPQDVHDYRINRNEFTIYIGGDPKHEDSHDTSSGLNEPGVEFMMADRFEINLDILSAIDPTRPILINMSSCGGDWNEGMKMFGAILTCPNPVTVVATKWARSMTSLIPLAADRFVIRPPAQYMVHRGLYGFYGLDQEAATADVERRKAGEMMLRIYVARLKEQGSLSSWSEKRIRETLEEKSRVHIDVWYSADEAKSWGFADDVFTGDTRKLRASKINIARRERMLEVLRRPITVTVNVS